MMSFIIVIHIIVCIGLIFFILIQSGRGGGLIANFSSAESIFGTKTNTFLTKTTAVFAIAFFISCLLLAFLSVHQNKSIVERGASKLLKEKQEEQGELIDTTQETNAANEPAATNQ